MALEVLNNYLKSNEGYEAKTGKVNEIQYTIWEYDVHLEDSKGNILSSKSADFHVVAGVVGEGGKESTNVYSKNGARPMEENTGTNSSFKPVPRDQARQNNRSNRLAFDEEGNPVYKVRTNMRERKVFVPTIESTRETTLQKNTNENRSGRLKKNAPQIKPKIKKQDD